jgi:hypothetical protein
VSVRVSVRVGACRYLPATFQQIASSFNERFVPTKKMQGDNRLEQLPTYKKICGEKRFHFLRGPLRIRHYKILHCETDLHIQNRCE